MLEIKSASYVTSLVEYENVPDKNLSQFLFCGRSNVGKSSFINALVKQKNLARTSQNPGKTQTINLYLINDLFYLVDVPGYGYARVSKEKKKSFGIMIEKFLKDTDKLKMCFLLVDFRHKPTEDDILMYNYLKYFNFNIKVIATKSDKVKNKDRKKNKEIILNTLNINSNDLIVTSSESREGLYLVNQVIEELI